MIHTGEMYSILDDEIKNNLEKRFRRNINFINQTVDLNKFKGIKFYFFKSYGIWNIKILINFIELLGKSNISEIDYKDAEKKLINIKTEIFDNDTKKIDLILTRIDFRKDIIIDDEEKRKLLLRLYKKSQKRINRKDKNTKYDKSVYFQNKSIVINIYDKVAERKNKNKSIQPYEENVIRLEIRLFPKHLNYKKRKYKIEQDLKQYFKDDVFSKYMCQHALPIVYNANYYKIDYIKKCLGKNLNKKFKSYKLNEKTFKEIIEMINTISKYGFDNLKRDKNYTYYKINKYLTILNELKISPIIIPIRENIEMIELKFFENILY